jgi:hypothetical protein
MSASTIPSAIADRTPRRRTSPEPAGHPRIIRLAGLIAAVVIADALLVAIVVRIMLAGEARGWLGYRFPGVPAHAADAIAIFAHNTQALSGVLGLLLIAQLAARAPGRPGRVQRTVQAAGEVILGGVTAANVLVVGAALGAYGTRMLRSMLPHGPVELAAYTLAIALYLQVRRRVLPARQLARAIAISVVLLAIAAVLETFVSV